ncbi:hypothetical protein [Paraburkholderia oxyphila]|uniref:hypothetical protein n=1 Tax=Paraburkholderia oxyphila TaxID=614212 RepID=UPI000694AF05|nr:hypothetical protein [Paraburkholderia oxyphila]
MSEYRDRRQNKQAKLSERSNQTFGLKATPELIARIDANRANSDLVFLARFITCFPEIEANHANPQQFAGFVFATLRGIGAFGLFDIAQDETEGQLEVLVQVIVEAGSLRWV